MIQKAVSVLITAFILMYLVVVCDGTGDEEGRENGIRAIANMLMRDESRETAEGEMVVQV